MFGDPLTQAAAPPRAPPDNSTHSDWHPARCKELVRDKEFNATVCLLLDPRNHPSVEEVVAGLVHHSDRGVQYAAHDYTALLLTHGLRISMWRRANPYDNAMAESFMKTLKYEEVYRNEYRDLAEARASIGHFLDQVYNEKLLHSALGYCPPAEFERSLAPLSGPRPGSWLATQRVRESAR